MAVTVSRLEVVLPASIQQKLADKRENAAQREALQPLLRQSAYNTLLDGLVSIAPSMFTSSTSPLPMESTYELPDRYYDALSNVVNTANEVSVNDINGNSINLDKKSYVNAIGFTELASKYWLLRTEERNGQIPQKLVKGLKLAEELAKVVASRVGGTQTEREGAQHMLVAYLICKHMGILDDPQLEILRDVGHIENSLDDTVRFRDILQGVITHFPEKNHNGASHAIDTNTEVDRITALSSPTVNIEVGGEAQLTGDVLENHSIALLDRLDHILANHDCVIVTPETVAHSREVGRMENGTFTTHELLFGTRDFQLLTGSNETVEVTRSLVFMTNATGEAVLASNRATIILPSRFIREGGIRREEYRRVDIDVINPTIKAGKEINTVSALNEAEQAVESLLS